MNLARADAIAVELGELFAGRFIVFSVVGSVRRRVQEPHDVEVLMIPTLLEDLQPDLLGHVAGQRNLVMERANELRGRGELTPRPDKLGRTAWGERFIRARLGGAAVDIFCCLPPAQWGLVELIRTGDSEFSHQALARWKEVTHGGWSKDGMLHNARGQCVITPTERDVFKALRWEYKDPRDRNIRTGTPLPGPALPIAPQREPILGVCIKHDWSGPWKPLPNGQARTCARCGAVWGATG